MIDIHPPQHGSITLRDSFIHLFIVIVGILIAIGLEQTVELIHHARQRQELQADLRAEAENNRAIIARDLRLQDLEPWFEQTMRAVDTATLQQGRIRITLGFAPCIPGSVGTASERYFAPSEAVWTTAKESSLVGLLPVEQARMYARLSHNYDLLANSREDFYHACSAVGAMQFRFAKIPSGATSSAGAAVWTLTSEQAERLAQVASDARTAIKGLCFRLRWSDVYEQGILSGESRADERMMRMNQERFEDNQDAIQ
ncbi:MAG TPA: hypothetical protein VFA99_03740 [Acidobacteriaceae bacterium]|nr:hypothetical protein [Acidobacteriaceae bacterium]